MTARKLRLPPTRNWEGKFQIEDKLIHETFALQFDFAKQRGDSIATVKGTGKNKFGTFKMEGKLLGFQPAHGFPFELVKHYQ